MLRRLLATPVALAAAAALLAGSPAPSFAGDPAFHRPSVGDCRALTPDVAGRPSDPAAPVDCSTSHTGRTVAVAQVPARIAWSDSDALGAFAVRSCVPAVERTLGRSQVVNALSAYSWVWFEPTRAERAQGARWVRCDLVLWGGRSLLRLPTDATPTLPAAPLPDAVAQCETGAGQSTTCSRAHRWRAKGGFVLDQARYPSDERSSAAIARRCGRITRTSAYKWTYQSKPAWKLGYRAVVCFAKTRA